MTNDLPFVFGKAAEGEHFTDRTQETEQLKMNFLHGINSIIISPRRWGKSSLVAKVADQVKDEASIKVIRMDIFGCRTPQDFYKLFATELIKQTSTHVEEWMTTAKHFLGSLVPVLTTNTDPYSPFSLTLRPTVKDFCEEVLTLPERIAVEKNVRLVVCIDEFQQIGDFVHSVDFQKLLRKNWQLQQHVSYCLYGSKRHMLMHLFNQSSKPFYKFGEILFLERIPLSYWKPFIIDRFAQSGKKISEAVVEELYQYVDGNSSYMQQLSWIMWSMTSHEVTHEGLELAKSRILEQNQPLFQEQLDKLSAYQLHFLHAVADGQGDRISHKEIIENYDLGSSANVAILKKTLISKELIDTFDSKLKISDPILHHWLQTTLFHSL